MSNNLINCSGLLKDERIQKELSEQFDFPSYWTLKEGLKFFSPIEEEGKRYPLRRIKTSKFEIIKRDIEIQKLETFNSQEEIKQILAYDPVADREKLKTQRSALRTTNIKWRNLQRYGSIDKERKLSPSQILDEKIMFFCSNIRIKPEVLICYIINHLELFSSDIEIPSKLARPIEDVQSPVKNNGGESGEDRDNQNSQYSFPGKQINSWDELEIILVSHDMITIKM